MDNTFLKLAILSTFWCHVYCINITFIIFYYPGICKMHDVSETGSASSIRSEEGKDPTLLGQFEGSSLDHSKSDTTHTSATEQCLAQYLYLYITKSANYVNVLPCITFTCFFFPIERIFCTSRILSLQ
jgi:hypothetical protein